MNTSSRKMSTKILGVGIPFFRGSSSGEWRMVYLFQQNQYSIRYSEKQPFF
nr:MAG TPA: hypothetical protein [Caudoviricetes sp.]